MTQAQPKKYLTVNGVKMAYVERGSGDPMLFLHGNPTSSYAWRNILAPLSKRYHCVAPDMVGMGDSDKLTSGGPERYSFFEQQRYMDAFVSALELDRPVILVVHDWGSALGFDWARRFPERVRGLSLIHI